MQRSRYSTCSSAINKLTHTIENDVARPSRQLQRSHLSPESVRSHMLSKLAYRDGIYIALY
jgi:hypothetical protein